MWQPSGLATCEADVYAFDLPGGIVIMIPTPIIRAVVAGYRELGMPLREIGRTTNPIRGYWFGLQHYINYAERRGAWDAHREWAS